MFALTLRALADWELTVKLRVASYLLGLLFLTTKCWDYRNTPPAGYHLLAIVHLLKKGLEHVKILVLIRGQVLDAIPHRHRGMTVIHLLFV